MNMEPELSARAERLEALLACGGGREPVAALSALLLLAASEAIACVAAKNGVRWEDCYALSGEVMQKTALLLGKAGMHPAELKDRLCGPDSAATQALGALEGARIRALLIDACDRAFDAARAARE